MKKRSLSLLLILLLTALALAGCAPQEPPTPTPAPAEPVTLTITGSWPDCRAIDEVAKVFTARYPNCTIVYEYLQDYYPALEKRMTGESPIDLFISSSIQADSNLVPYALDLSARDDLDISQTFKGLIDNFRYIEENGEATKLYSIPLGGEMRGLYVNETLLKSVGLDVPTDQASLLAACETLKQHGYIAFHDNPGNFSQLLVFPWIANSIANADDPKAAYDRVNAHEPGLSEMFVEPYAFLYTLVENGYYDYKRAQTELNLFTLVDDESVSRDFMNIRTNADGSFEKIDDVGRVAFMPGAMSLQGTVEKTKEDYHSEIEYRFILAPVGQDGGYAYLSPAHGIGANKLSKNLDWSVRFLDFLFQPENNKIFAEAFDIIPNTADALAYIRSLYDVPDNRICELGQVTFDYGFYAMLQSSLVDISKANNPKYMQDDGNGNLSLYPMQYYIDELEASIAAQ